MIGDKAALTLRAIVLRTARSPLKPLWRGSDVVMPDGSNYYNPCAYIAGGRSTR